MKAFVRIAILSFFLTAGISCTYQRPLFSIRVSRKTVTDSVTHATRKQNNYNYWGLKKPTHLGGYSKAVKLDSLGNKIEVRHWRKNPFNMQDGNVRYYTKMIYYKRSGEKEKITKRIFQNQGIGGYVALDKTIYFEKGKKLKTSGDSLK